MEWTPADQCRPRTTKLDAVSLDDVRDRMLLAKPLGFDAFRFG